MKNVIMSWPLYLRAIILAYLILTIAFSGTFVALRLVKHEKTVFIVFIIHLLILIFLLGSVSGNG